MDKNVKVAIIGTGRRKSLLSQIIALAEKNDCYKNGDTKPEIPDSATPDELDALTRQQIDIIRACVSKEFYDSTSADDWLFSELPIYIGDIDRLYGGIPSVILYAGSAIPGPAPISPTYDELLPYVGSHVVIAKRKYSLFDGDYTVICADTDGQPVLFTEGDIPALKDAEQSTFMFGYANFRGCPSDPPDISLWDDMAEKTIWSIKAKEE